MISLALQNTVESKSIIDSLLSTNQYGNIKERKKHFFQVLIENLEYLSTNEILDYSSTEAEDIILMYDNTPEVIIDTLIQNSPTTTELNFLSVDTELLGCINKYNDELFIVSDNGQNSVAVETYLRFIASGDSAFTGTELNEIKLFVQFLDNGDYTNLQKVSKEI